MLFFGTYVSSNNSKFMVSTKIYNKNIFEHKRLYAICWRYPGIDSKWSLYGSVFIIQPGLECFIETLNTLNSMKEIQFINLQLRRPSSDMLTKVEVCIKWNLFWMLLFVRIVKIHPFIYTDCCLVDLVIFIQNVLNWSSSEMKVFCLVTYADFANVFIQFA